MTNHVTTKELRKQARTGSLFDYRPVIYYDKEHDQKMVAWHGFILPWEAALSIVGQAFGILVQSQAREELNNRYEYLYRMGAIVDDVERKNTKLLRVAEKVLLNGIVREMENEGLELTEALEWFKD